MYIEQVALLTVALAACLTDLTSAEPPRWKSSNAARFRPFQRLEAAASSSVPPVPHTEYGPPPAPAPSYGPPPPSPSASYGPPQEEQPSLTTTEGATTELSATTEKDAETIEPSGGLKEPTGSYYIYHPNGLLQRVTYATKDDDRRMAFDLKLKYENVDPINGPIYTYDPRTLVLQKLQNAPV